MEFNLTTTGYAEGGATFRSNLEEIEDFIYYDDGEINCSLVEINEDIARDFNQPPETWVVITVTSLSLICFAGLLANTFSLWIMYVNRRTHNTVDLVMAAICITDLILAVEIPAHAAAYAHLDFWPFGKNSNWLCKAVGICAYFCSYTCVFYMALLSYYRYCIISSAKVARITQSTSWSAIITIVFAIPLLSLSLAMPIILFFSLKLPTNNVPYFRCQLELLEKYQCTFHPPNLLWSSIGVWIRNVAGFIVPLVVISFYNIMISREVRRRLLSLQPTQFSKPESSSLNVSDLSSTQEQMTSLFQLPVRLKKSLFRTKIIAAKIQPTKYTDATTHMNKVLRLVIVAFLVCWLPNCLSQFEFHLSMKLTQYKGGDWVPPWHNVSSLWTRIEYNEHRRKLHYFTVVLFYSHIVINPVIYQLYSHKFRQRVRTTLSKFRPLKTSGRESPLNTKSTVLSAQSAVRVHQVT